MELYSRSKSENLKLFFNYSLVISAIRNFTQSELLRLYRIRGSQIYTWTLADLEDRLSGWYF